MNLQEYHQLQSERTALDKLILQLSETAVIERMSLEARKSEIEDTLSAQTSPSREPVRARLTFRGKPIVGNHGIFADFGAAAVDAFTQAVAAIGASQYGPLGARGVLPNRDDYQLLITGTALGSFGFELEEAPKDEILFPELSPIESALEHTKEIMEALLGTDDELTDAISETDQRALDALQAFLKKIADQEAVCALEFKNKVFRFADVGQVRGSVNRLSHDNIHESRQNIRGDFQGVLPNRRTFEFMIADTQEIIAGKVGKTIPDAGAINHILNQTTTIEAQETRVGTGHPRYVLLGYKVPANKLQEIGHSQ